MQVELVLGRYENVSEIFEDLILCEPEMSTEKLFLATMLAAEAQLELGNRKTSYSLLNEVWKQLKKSSNPEDVPVAKNVLIQLAYVSAIIGDLRYSSQLLAHLRKETESTETQKEAILLASRLKIIQAINYYQRSNYTAAYEEFSSAIKLRNKLNLSNDRELIGLHLWAAQISVQLCKRDRFQIPESHLLRAAGLLAKARFDHSLEDSQVLRSKAQIKSLQGDMQEAVSLYEASIKTRNSVTSNHPDNQMCELALIPLKESLAPSVILGKYSIAIETLSEESYIEASTASVNLASYYSSGGQRKRALSICQCVVSSLESEVSPRHPVLAAAKCLSADLLIREGEVIQAQKLLIQYDDHLSNAADDGSEYDASTTNLIKQSVQHRLVELARVSQIPTPE